MTETFGEVSTLRRALHLSSLVWSAMLASRHFKATESSKTNTWYMARLLLFFYVLLNEERLYFTRYSLSEAILGSNRKRVAVTKRGVLPHSISTDLRTHSQWYHIFARLFPVGTISKRNTARKEKASEIFRSTWLTHKRDSFILKGLITNLSFELMQNRIE